MRDEVAVALLDNADSPIPSNIAVTLYEYTYATWSLLDGTCLGSRFHQEPGWKLSDDSIEKIKEIKHET